MKLHLLDRTSQDHNSFNVSLNSYPHFLKVWHYHPELELVSILKSTGTHFIGDNIERFDVGDVILIGRNLPHMWLNDDTYFNQKKENEAEAVAIHFKNDFLGDAFLMATENKNILELIGKAKRGLKFSGVTSSIIEDINSLLGLKPFKRMIRFIEILNSLANHKNSKVLSSPSFLDNFHLTDNSRLHKIYEFVYNGFKENINSRDVAEYIGMNPSAFSRYFKSIHRKNFTTYLNEIRVGYACKLLLEHDINITAISFECGFNNLSNFNRQFKAITSSSPSKYIQLHTG